jgi:hypothetical protein
MQKYDVIIVGAGLSGLYSAYNIKKLQPNTKLLVLESNKQPYIGGRIGNDIFYGENIVVGAGVGRKDTDKLLIKLLKELDIKYVPFTVEMNYSNKLINYGHYIDIKHCLDELRRNYTKIGKNVTFKKFATEHLGKKEYKNFVISSGYSDYENEDVYEVLYHYQMDDNAPGWTGMQIQWSSLISKLCDTIGTKNIIASTKVENIHNIYKSETTNNNNTGCCLFEIKTSSKQHPVFYSEKVIIATRISTVQKLLPKMKIYKQIHGQPFLYIYAKFDKKSSDIMSRIVPVYTIVTGFLQKLIPFSKSVYMIAYSDNKNAEILQKYKENTPKNRAFFEKLLEETFGLKNHTLKILAIKDYYWTIGTHYFEPLNLTKYKTREEFINKAQHPEPGMLVVGEAISRRQGWTEGALESVHAVLNNKWIIDDKCK